MTDFLFRKMWKNRWLMLSLLVGNILLIGIVAATPLYTQATMERILQQNFRRFQQEYNEHPAIMGVRFNFSQSNPEWMLYNFAETINTIIPEMIQSIDIPAARIIETHTLANWHLSPALVRESTPRPRNVMLMGNDGLGENVNIIYGRLPSDSLAVNEETGEFNVIEAITTEAVLLRHNLLADELLVVGNVNSPLGRLYVRIVGTYEHAAGSEIYWSTLQFNPINNLMVSGDLVRSRLISTTPSEYRIISDWYILLDYSAFSANLLERYIYNLQALDARFYRTVRQFTENFTGTLEAHEAYTAPLVTTLWVLQVPMYVLLALYIYMVSRQILTLEQNEISVLKSRGASRQQLMGIYCLQGIFVAVISMPVGIWLGVLLCRMLGASNGFLYMVQRAALTVRVTPTVFMYAGLAMFLSFLTMLVPVIGFSRIAIVEHKQKKRGKSGRKALWQRFFLDILCIGVAVYGLFTFHGRQEIMAAMVRDVASVDPLLFVSSSMFIIGTGLFALRLFPHLIKLIYFIGNRFWSPQAYAALIRVVRSAGEEQFIMIFLIFTLAAGIFSANAARTINTNTDHLILYMAGADLVFQEYWRNNIPHEESIARGARVPEHLIYVEPDFERFTHFEETYALTQVMRHSVSLSQQGSLVEDVGLMAVETHTFGDTIWFRDDLTRIHINHYLNALAENPEGVLLSYNFREFLGYQLGDVVNVGIIRDYGVIFEFDARLEVVGFVEHWPGYAPVARVDLRTGEAIHTDQFLAVANLRHLQALWGVLPYEVWMRTNGPTNHFFYDFLDENNLHIIGFYDTRASLVESRLSPVLQGTNGVLTVSFIVTLLICFAGFLIYWILSIRSRVLQFGIFRAMGMSMGRVLALLVNEQLFITFSAVIIGAVVGEITAYLFVPLIQLSYTAAEQVIPLMVVTDARDYRNIYMVIGIMVAVSLLILGAYITRIKIDQALKLGED